MSGFAKQIPAAGLESNEPRRSTYLDRVLVVALVLCPLFLAIMGGFWLESLKEDFPEEYFWEPLVGFFMAFPLLFATGPAPCGLPQTSCLFVAVAIDGLFWAFAGVSIYSVFTWLVHRRRLSDETLAA
jgi:hypothetical protein